MKKLFAMAAMAMTIAFTSCENGGNSSVAGEWKYTKSNSDWTLIEEYSISGSGSYSYEQYSSPSDAIVEKSGSGSYTYDEGGALITFSGNEGYGTFVVMFTGNNMSLTDMNGSSRVFTKQ